MKSSILSIITVIVFFVCIESCNSNSDVPVKNGTSFIEVRTEKTRNIDTIIKFTPAKYGITELSKYPIRHNEKPGDNHHLIEMAYTMYFYDSNGKILTAEMGRYDHFLFDESYNIVEPRTVIRFNKERFAQKYQQLKAATKDDFILTIHRTGTKDSFKDELTRVTFKEKYSGDKITSMPIVFWENGSLTIDGLDN